MLSLPFQTVRAIEQDIARGALPLEGLVLVLTTNAGAERLPVYLDEGLPTKPLPGPAKSLSTLTEEDLLRWEGVAVGFGALDLLWPLLPTHGPAFYEIGRLYEARGRLDLYRDTARRLAVALAERVEPSERRDRKLVELLLPTWLHRDPPGGSVALALERRRIGDYLTDGASPRWLAVDDLRQAELNEDWVLTFPEASAAFATLQGKRLLDWRPLLRRQRAEGLLVQALEALARGLGEEADRRQVPDLRRLAYALALERWLPEQADEQLVAVLTPSDFERFRSTGDALCVSRVPPIYTGDGHRLALDRLLDPGWMEANRQQWDGPWFALRALVPGLRQLAPSKPAAELVSLEPIWYRTGALASLAIALQGLANDASHSQLPGLRTLRLSAAERGALALKGTYLIGLSDPWDDAWGGRYGVSLDASYRVLDDVLLAAGQASQGKTLEAIRRWLSFYGTEDPALRWPDLQEIVHGREAIVEEAERARDDILRRLADGTQELMEAARVLLGNKAPAHWTGSPIPTTEFQEALVTQPIPALVSDHFRRALAEWSDFHHRLQRVEQEMALTPPKAETLEELLRDNRQLLRRLYALPHEQALLSHVGGQDRQRLERLLSALRQDVALHVELLTPQVVLGERTRLSVQVANIGGRGAAALCVVLEQTPALQVEDEPVRVVGALPARGVPQRLEWQVLPKTAPLVVRVRCEYAEGEGKRGEHFDLSLPAIAKPGPGRRPHEGNPFQAGVAVWGERFFNRRQELKWVFDLLLGGVTQPILLRGPRRMGKTSILHQIVYLLTHEGELQRQLGYSREATAQIRRWRPVRATMQPVHTPSDVPGWYAQLFGDITKAAGILGQPLGTEAFQRNPHGEFGWRLKQLINEYPELHVLILLDEWDTERHVPEFGGQLRALMQDAELSRVNWVFASTWMLSSEAGRFTSPFYAQTRAIELRELPWHEAQALLKTLSERVDIVWQGEAVVTLLDQTARRPYLLQAIGQRIYDHLANPDKPSNLVIMEVVNAVLNEVVRTSHGQGSPFAFLWEPQRREDEDIAASLSWLARMILLTLDEAHPSPLREVDILDRIRAKLRERGWKYPEPDRLLDDLREDLSLLVLVFDVLKLEDRHYAFGIPLAQAWFREAIRRQSDDPWQEAWERLQLEYELRKATRMSRRAL